ncbi:MAG: bifunctional ornithine acetyltransferase/N-acetylglutamate synthase, partial [Candidatus Omnitrophica bacterium]|nr:bifunctional ornithine acetyltransferase/N-acetylglutamate synthase [Candidatus Omnitrophota bacterium]
MAGCAAQGLGLKKEEVLVASTGIIGKRLDVAKIKKAVPQLIKGLSIHGIHKAKKAIMTTDTFVKEISVKCLIGSSPVTICGIAKGAGMISPDMATMLGFIFTDANITQGALDKSLGLCVEGSFNCITVDGCMSTNDTVIVLANAASGSKPIKNGRDFAIFNKALGIVCLELAKAIVRDGEGATKFIRIKVKNAANAREAKVAALAIANSNLFKCAMYGSSTNIVGRIVAAIGSSGVAAREEALSIKFSPLKQKEIDIEVGLARGTASAVVYTSDLSPEYVKINAEYN